MLCQNIDQATLRACLADFRKCLAVYILYYYCRLLPHFAYIFSAQGMVDRKELGPVFAHSLLFLSDSEWWLYGLFAGLLLLSALFFLDKLNRLGLMILFLLNLSFQNANPYILHEPQQVTSLFLLIFAFFLPTGEDELDPFLFKGLVLFLGVYYFVVGFKKALDPLWLRGDALSALLHWNMIGIDNAITRWLLKYPWLTRMLDFLTIFFELSFLAALFTRWFFVYVFAGILFHLFIRLTCSVGTFSEIMLVWYALVLRLALRERGQQL